MNRKRRLKIDDFNPHLICVLCGGYFIDATTIIECLHSFCRACIVRYLETNRFCPICDVQVHKSKPLQNIRPDRTLQDLVYKLVPGLYQSEIKSRREFYESHPECSPHDATDESLIYTPDECFSLTLEYYQESSHPLIKHPALMKQEPVTGDEDSRTEESRGNLTSSNMDDTGEITNLTTLVVKPFRTTVELSRKDQEPPQESGLYINKHVPCKNQVDSRCDTQEQSPSRIPNDQLCHDQEVEQWRNQSKRLCVNEEACSMKKRHLRCPAAVTITHLQKLIRAKYDLDRNHPVEILHKDEPLSDHLTLIDVAYIYKWRRKGPLNLFFRIFETAAEQECKQDILNSHTCASEISRAECKGSIEKMKAKNKIDDWKEVQLQISETGIMSVAGVSLEHNNNLSSSNNNLLSNSIAKGSDPAGVVKNHNDQQDLQTPILDKDVTSNKPSIPELRCIPSADLKVPEGIPILTSQAKQLNVTGNLNIQETDSLVVDNNRVGQSLNPVKVESESVGTKVGNVSSDKVNNVISEKRKIATPIKISESCVNTPKRTKLSPTKPLESLDLSLKPVKKEKIANSIIPSVETVNSNDSKSGHKPNSKPMPPNTSFKVDLDTKRSFSSDHDLNLKDKKNPIAVTSVAAPPAIHSKKSPNASPMGYKTLKVPPKTWNPSITRSSYLNSKTSPDCSLNSNSSSSLVKTPEKVPKFFKMRNMPRYLGNPASGVKPMYQVATDCKSQETSDSSNKSKQVVMKIDPKTLCPIMAVAPVTSSTSVTCSPGKPFYTTPPSPDIGPSAADAPKTSLRNKNNSPPRKSHASVPSPSATNSSPPVGFSHTARTGSPFASTALNNTVLTNAALTNAALSARSPPATTSNNILLSPTNYAINPATLNLLSSNLSFLPNAPNFLYGNYANFAPPLIRPNLSMAGPGSGLPSALPLGAFHAMPPSINMLFPHHRTNNGSGFASSTNRAQTPAIQRIPASKGNGNNTNAAYKTAKSANHSSPKNNQTPSVQRPANNHTPVKTNSSTIPVNEKNARDMSVGLKKNSSHREEGYSTKHTIPISEINSSNNNNNKANISKSKNTIISEVMTFNNEEVNPSIVDAPAPVTLVEKCDATKEASPATDSHGQSEPEASSSKPEVESHVALEMKVLPSSALVTSDASCKQTDIAKVPDLPSDNCDIDGSGEQSLGAIVDGCINSKSSVTIESNEKVVK